MKGKQLRSFKNLLDGSRLAVEFELQRALREREGITVGQAFGDDVDLMMDSAEREITIHKLESKSQVLRNIREALSRIASGTYGICAYCREEISAKRLVAVPWTPFCIGCQELAERNHVEVIRCVEWPDGHAA
jgi:DnaK suppressor protein